jgi:hypothetical protein
MNRAMNRITTLVIACAAASAALAQDRVAVPLSSPSQPATVKARLISGSITVTAGSGSEVVVETQASARPGRERVTPPPPPGMHQIDVGGRGFSVEEDHNVVTVIPDMRGGRNGDNLTIQVPVNTSLELKTVNGGNVDVTGISGDLDVENTNGSITLKNVAGAVVAHTVNGAVTVSLDRVAADKPMSFTSLNGRVDVTLPADAKARLRLKTTNGAVYSDFEVKMEADNSKPVIDDNRSKGGRYRIRMDHGVSGTINGGGPDYTFQTMNGDILIHKK